MTEPMKRTAPSSKLARRSKCALYRALAACLFAIPAAGQAPDAAPRLLKVSSDFREPAGKSVVIYAMPAISGTGLYFTVKPPAGSLDRDSIQVALFTPRGELMLSERGAGHAGVVATLPLDGVYLVAVTRADSTKPFEVNAIPGSVAAQDVWWWRFIGYDLLGPTEIRSCWTTLASLRWIRTYISASAKPLVVKFERLRSGKVVRDSVSANGTIITDTLSLVFRGGQAYEMSRRDVTQKTRSARLVPYMNPTDELRDAGLTLGPYRSYLCRNEEREP